jgi:hypothetical protein
MKPTLRENAGHCLTWWLENDHIPYSPEEIHSIFRRLATQGVRRVLAAT